MRGLLSTKKRESFTFVAFVVFIIMLHLILLYALLNHYWRVGHEDSEVGTFDGLEINEDELAKRAKVKELVKFGTIETTSIEPTLDQKLGWTAYEESLHFPLPSTKLQFTTTITTLPPIKPTTAFDLSTTSEYIYTLTQEDNEYLKNRQRTSIELTEEPTHLEEKTDFKSSIASKLPSATIIPSTTTKKTQLDEVSVIPVEFVSHKYSDDKPRPIHITQNLLRKLQPPENKHRHHNYDHYGIIEKPNTTLITALMDIGRGYWDSYRRPMTKYHDYMYHVLMLKVSMVAFVDNNSSEFVAKTRKAAGLENITKVFEIHLNALPLFQHLDVFRTIIHNELYGGGWQLNWDESMKTHPEAKSAEYDLVVNSKPYFVYNVSTDNPFNTHFFAWIDAGYGQAKPEYFPQNYEWKPFFPIGRISLAKVTPYYDDIKRYTLQELYRKNRAVISGGFFGGDEAAVRELYLKYNAKMLELLFQYQVVDDDQTTFVLVINEYPTLFNVLHADWFDAFKLFRRRRRHHHRHRRHHNRLP